HRTHKGAVDIEEVLDEVPEDPEPAGTSGPAPLESPEPCPDTAPAAEHGRLPGRIVIDDGDDLPDRRFTAQYDIEGIGRPMDGDLAGAFPRPPENLHPHALYQGEYRLVRQIASPGSSSFHGGDDISPQPSLDHVVERLREQEYVRRMPYCDDDSERQ